MPNNEATERKHTTKLLIGVAGISLVIGLGIGYIAFFCSHGCMVSGVYTCPCPYNLRKLPEAIEQLKATDGQLKTIHEQLKEVIEKLGGLP